MPRPQRAAAAAAPAAWAQLRDRPYDVHNAKRRKLAPGERPSKKRAATQATPGAIDIAAKRSKLEERPSKKRAATQATPGAIDIPARPAAPEARKRKAPVDDESAAEHRTTQRPTPGAPAKRRKLAPKRTAPATGGASDAMVRRPLCLHNRNRSLCKDCAGTSICLHARRRNECKDCAGAGICLHNRCKFNCKECVGSNICHHNRLRRFCRDCGGSSFCQHNRRRIICKDCGGSGICQHNRQRYRCKDCGAPAAKKKRVPEHKKH